MVSPDGSIVLLKNIKRKPRLISQRDCLRLNFTWTCIKGSCYYLQMLFGMTATCVSVHLWFVQRILIQVLQSQQSSTIQLPCDNLINNYMESVTNPHHVLQYVWCTIDRLKLRLQQAGNNKKSKNVLQLLYAWSLRFSYFCFCSRWSDTYLLLAKTFPNSIHNSKIAKWGYI